MVIRKAGAADWNQVLELAQTCRLDYTGMETDDFWIAEEGGRVSGIVALKLHPECRELCALGVDEKYRGRGLGKRLVHELCSQVRGDLHLATIIPDFFAKLGFERAEVIPPSMIKNSDWCAGCRRDLCVVMIRRGQ
jgi:N-acetylglutamate synthase-like GNAT family acetyltransferase